MKSIIVILLACIVLIAAKCEQSDYNGEPGCKTQEEIDRIVYENFWDPTHYWRCTNINVPAISERCPDGYAFIASLRACVQWIDWVWEPKTSPPSCPGLAETAKLIYNPVATNSV